MIDGKTKVCGLIGNPVGHTLSPMIHNGLSHAMELNLSYVPFAVEEDRLKEAIEGAYALNIWGLNVTVPYKSQVISYLKETDPLARRIGAVNTLVRTEGGYKGYNTDMPGLCRGMKSDGITIREESVIVLGAGGAARAVAVLLAEQGAKEIIICNRTPEKAEAIAVEINGYMDRNIARGMNLASYEELAGKKYLAVQTTSVGLYPRNREAVITDKAFYSLIHTGYDLIMNPSCTRFMELTREAGGKAYNGLKMLLYQGIIAYELWNQVEVTGEQAAKIYEQLQEELAKRETD